MEHHDSELKDKIENSKKMEDVKYDDFSKIQDYMSGKVLENTRMAFKIRCNMVEDIKGNFSAKYKRHGGEEATICDECNERKIQTQSHCLVCPKWEEIRSDLDLQQIDDMVKFFQRLLEERMKSKVGSMDGAAY